MSFKLVKPLFFIDVIYKYFIPDLLLLPIKSKTL